MTRSKKLDCPILVDECLAVPEAILMAIQKGIQQIIIQNDSQLIINSINGKIRVQKDVKYFLARFSDSKVEYYRVLLGMLML